MCGCKDNLKYQHAEVTALYTGMMGRWAFCVGLSILQILGTFEAKLHFAAIFPSELRAQHSENLCLQLEGAEGAINVTVSLNLDNKDTELIDKNFQQESIFTCLNFQVPISDQNEAVGRLTLFIRSSGKSVTETSKVLVKKELSKILVQTDKPVYKPGQTVKFRILSLNEDFKPENTQIPVVELQDPGKNRIGQWLNVTLNQGLAELSFALSSEPTLGEYSITLKDISHTFTVEEYVLPKFEVDIQVPKYVLFYSDQFALKVCAKYTYGKPVQGEVTASICRGSTYNWDWNSRAQKYPICANFTEKLDRSGCHTIEVKSELLNLYNTSMSKELKGSASVTEEGTGVEMSSTIQTIVTTVINKLSFVNADNNYKPGIPYRGAIKVEDAGGAPKFNIKVYLNYNDESQVLVTNKNGQASFTLNTTNWTNDVYLTVHTDKEPEVGGTHQPYYGEASQKVVPYNFRTKSFLKVNSLEKVLPCEGYQEVHVEYIISHTEVKEAKKLSLHYLLVSRVSIISSGTVEIKMEDTNEDVYGKVTLNLPLSSDTSNTLNILVYILLPDGEMVADTAKFFVQKCFKNKVTAGFSPSEVLPGSEVSLQVEAAPGSLCGLRVVDHSVVLMNPEKELTANKVFYLFSSLDSGSYDHRVQDHKETCGFSPFFSSHRRPRKQNKPSDTMDVYSLFKGLRLKIITSAVIKKPLVCPSYRQQDWRRKRLKGFRHSTFTSSGYRINNIVVLEEEEKEEEPSIEPNKPIEPKDAERVRTYFPETWIWELVAVGESGRADIHHKAPDTITDWNAGALCLGPSGFGLSPSSPLRVFQPFFVDLTLPYSIIRGESFTLKASVFNYLKECIKVNTALQTTDELEEKPCPDCQYSSCICADESKTFYWNLKATKLGEVNITVRTEAVDTKEFCGNEIPVVPKQGRSDTIVKTLLVQPGGILVEKSHNSLVCLKEEGQPKVEEISLKIPNNVLKDSARTHILVLGDLMGSAMQNLGHLLAMPYGCGEQNMVLFAPNIFILQYLEKTHQLNNEIQSKAKNFLERGYQRQLTYKHDDGSYSAFGKNDKEGNTWLTGFVVKSFGKARPYIFIDDTHLNQAFSWLKNNQQDTGCFRNVGRLFNNAMKGGVEDEISLSAYITIALLESRISVQDPLLSNALSCLRKASVNVSNVYTQALLAYTFTLSGETEIRETLMDKLEEKAVQGDGQLYWKRDSAPPPSEVSYWHRAPSAEVEMTSYVLLALLSGPTQDIGKALQIVKWLSKQQNPYGGFSSTQDTVVALQALAKYAELTFSDKGDVSVAVSSKSGFLEQFHVDKNNRLLLQRAKLSKVPEDYTVTTIGAGCVFIQAVLRYNVPPPKDEATFSLSVKSPTRGYCLEDPVTEFEILITAAYTGTREKSNMAVIEVKMLSGYIPVKSTIRKLEKDKLIQRSDIQTDSVTLYLDQMDHNLVNLSFMVEQDIVVKDLKLATAKVYDYYETDEHASAEYNHPCSHDTTGNSR
ncbi:alpha-2-macroglobulin-like isoform X2 [Dendropsophus ebraccatus]|uniref:alpha-2-macroglobulin-like isoform X2 n=1 Tax=Dendropsophus ebraccatus TaxID=150705 RepID=UPI003831FEE4